MKNNLLQIKKIIKEQVQIAFILYESKQNIINLGYPEIIASLIAERFGKNDYIIAKWWKDTFGYKFKEITWTDDHKRIEAEHPTYPADWWRKANDEWSFNRQQISLATMVAIYEAAQQSEEKYREIMNKEGYKVYDDEPWDQIEKLRHLKNQISYKMFNDIFFSYHTLIKDITSGKLTDLKPYKDLPYSAAQDKYDKKRTIKNPSMVIKTYPNNWKWINVGDKCQLVGKLMKNCGSAGVMSSDPDKTIITLFDKENKPHVMVTYSPNEKRISGDQGQGSTKVKNKYHDYVIDLTQILGASFDFEKSDSIMLKIKGALIGQLKSIEQIKPNTPTLDEFFKITLNDDSVWFTDSYSFVPEKDILKIGSGNIEKGLTELFGKSYRHGEAPQVTRVRIHQFAQGSRSTPSGNY